MDLIVTIVMLVPVLLAVALIVGVIRKNIVERQPGEPVDITGAIPAVIVLMVAVLIIGSMGASIAPYSYDEDSGELTINKDVGSGSQDWDSYGSDVKSLIINDNVTTVADGAFDTLTGLEYLSISDSVETITSSAFGVTLKDYLDQTTEPEAGEYVGTGDGTLYLCDPSIFTYNTTGNTITGLVNAASVVNLVIPNETDGVRITSTFASAFKDNTTLTTALVLPGSNLESMGNGTFQGCTSLARVTLPDIAVIPNFAFYNCTTLAEISIPSTVTAINTNAFYNTGLTSIALPSTVTTIGTNVFKGCTSITSVSFGDGFNASLGSDWAYSWTFYDSDGTTTLDKTVASNLAGYTFQGTASALVKVLPDRSALTTAQTLQVQELTKAASLTLKLAETEISSVEEKELASA